MEEKIKKILSETFKVPILEIDNNFSTKLYAWEFENMVFRSLS